jgi:hypothetical protein
MQRSSQTSEDDMSEDTAGVLQGLVADGVITGFELSGGGDVASLSVCAPAGSDALETEAAVKAAIRKPWRVAVVPTGGA